MKALKSYLPLILCLVIFIKGYLDINFESKPITKGLALIIGNDSYKKIEGVHIALSPTNRMKGLFIKTNIEYSDTINFQFSIPEKVEVINFDSTLYDYDLKISPQKNGTDISIVYPNENKNRKYFKGIKKRIFNISLKIIDNEFDGYGKLSLNVGGDALKRPNTHIFPVSLALNLPYKSDFYFENKPPDNYKNLTDNFATPTLQWYDLTKDIVSSAVEYYTPNHKQMMERKHLLGNIFLALSMSFFVNWLFARFPIGKKSNENASKMLVKKKNDNEYEVRIIESSDTESY